MKPLMFEFNACKLVPQVWKFDELLSQRLLKKLEVLETASEQVRELDVGAGRD
jgi:hypothetical protein